MMSRLSRSLVLATLLAVLVGGSSRTSAQAQTAQQFVEQQQTSAQALLRRPASDARSRDIAQLFEGMLDYEELARRSLSRHWAERTPAQQSEFVTLIRQLVERGYQDNLQRTANFDVRVLGSETQGDATLVRTEARSRTNRRAPAVQIDYSLRQVGGRWRVFDIHTDGVSLVSNYRSQFNRILGREGWDGLIARMRQRVSGGGTTL